MELTEGTRGAGAAGRRLELLGAARLVGGGGGPVKLERKAAALVAWVALERQASRQRAAELLWAGAEETARGNMRQLLRRLKVATGLGLGEGREELALPEGLAVDALLLAEHVGAGRHAEALALGSGGPLLAPFDYADVPAFDAWLVQTRERLGGLQRRAVLAEAERLERAGELTRALALAERHLAADGTSEETFRLLMRLHYLLGDRTAALGLYEVCRQTLARELGALPMPETVRLAEEVARAAVPAPPAAASRASRGAPPRLPASVLRPPVLAGRERAWAEAEAAWERGQAITFAGEGGMGKSRLAADFVSTKGAFFHYQGRPGEELVPYSTCVRVLRKLLSQRPGLHLEGWVRAELSRILPELGEPGAAPLPPLQDDADRIRLWDAFGVLFERALEGVASILVDDFQYMDPAAVLIGEYIFGRMYPFTPGKFRNVTCIRPSELLPDNAAMLQRMIGAGIIHRIDLEPLDTAGVRALLEGTGVPGAAARAEELARYTGGNPLFVTEALKHLLESGGLEGRGVEHLPSQLGQVAPLIQRRLERLSRPALRLAQVAALAGTHFTLEVAGRVMEVPALELDGPVAELEAAQILRGSGPSSDAFSHDLVQEAVKAAIPAHVQRLLHQRLAEALEARRAPPAVVAQHWLASAEPWRARPALLAAADGYDAMLRTQEAAELRARAAALQAAGHG
jgi:DNA-binding SARP family transcriptional activator